MTTQISFRDIIDLPTWRPLADSPYASPAGPGFIGDLRNNDDRHPCIFYPHSSDEIDFYDVKNNEWIDILDPSLSAVPVGGVFMPSQGPRGTLAVGSTTTSIILSTALPASVAPNQLANRSDGTGFKIRIIGNGTNSSSGKIDEKTIIANSSGTTPTIVLNSALSFTPQSGDGYEFLSGRLFMMANSNIAGSWKYFDVATYSVSGNLSTTNLPASPYDNSFIGLDELFVPYNQSPGTGFLGNLTATASSSTTITGQLSGGDSSVLANEYRNFQIRIIQDTVKPTSVGQRRNITSHTVGPSPIYTVSVWTVTPSSNATFVIENNSDRILLWINGQTNTFTYNISSDTWDTTTFAARPAAAAAGVTSGHAFSIVPDTNKNTRQSFIFSFRAGGNAALDLLDIAGDSNGTWSGNITYANKRHQFSTGTCGIVEPVTLEGKYLYINYNAGRRFFRFDMKNRVLETSTFLNFTSSDISNSAQRIASTHFHSGTTKLAFLISIRSNQFEVFQLIITR